MINTEDVVLLIKSVVHLFHFDKNKSRETKPSIKKIKTNIKIYNKLPDIKKILI